jgi:hypothetical protein
MTMPSFHGSLVQAAKEGYSLRECVFCGNHVWDCKEDDRSEVRKLLGPYCPTPKCEGRAREFLK